MAKSPANIIWITTDHMRYDCIRAYGNDEIITPNLDRLVAGGVSFHNCYVQNPLCMPSRASFMTGLYPQQTGVTANGCTLPADFTPTVAGEMKREGYRTVQVGKLHFDNHHDHDLRNAPDNTYGFDILLRSESRGCYDDAYTRWLRTKAPDKAHLFRTPRPTDPERQGSEKNGYAVDAPWQLSHSGFVSQTAIRHLSFGGRSFVHMGLHNPHPPLNPTRDAFKAYEHADLSVPAHVEREWDDKPSPLANMLRSRSDWTDDDFREYKRHFYGLVTEADFAVGQLLDHLTNKGLLASSLVIFSSDHGDMLGNHRMTHKAPHFYDEVMRVPCILHWPEGLGSERRDVQGLTEKIDILPTIIGLSGGMAAAVMQGRDLSGALMAGEQPAGRESVYAYHEGGYAMLRTSRWKYIRYGDEDREVLYGLEDEQREVVNRAADPAYRQALESMRSRMLTRTLAACRSPRVRVERY